MLIYDKIAWYMDNCPDVAKVSLGKEKYRLVSKGFDDMDAAGYSYGIVPLTLELLQEFADMYKNYIIQKENPHPVDVYAHCSSRMSTVSMYIAYVKDPDGYLVAAGICSLKIMKGKQTFMLSFRAKSGNTTFQKLHLGYYIENLFFAQGVSLNVEQFSRGRDTNGYGLLGSAIGVCTHKIQLHFSPYKSYGSQCIDIDEKSITKNALFIVGSDEDPEKKLDKAILYITDQDQKSSKYIDLIHILHKRGFSVDVRSCT